MTTPEDDDELDESNNAADFCCDSLYFSSIAIFYWVYLLNLEVVVVLFYETQDVSKPQ